MPTSFFDLFKIGIGPSSSHTVGPMRAAYRFAEGLANSGSLDRVTGLRIELFGSLGLTGRGHGTDRGILLGLMGERPDGIDPAGVAARIEAVRSSCELLLYGRRTIPFHVDRDLVFDGAHSLPFHPNGMRFTASPGISSRVFFSVGGGFVVEEGETSAEGGAKAALRYPFRSADEMLQMGRDRCLRIDEMVMANELAWRAAPEILQGIARIWQAMQDCTARGLATEGILPGGLDVVRRAPSLRMRLGNPRADPLAAMDWLNVWAIAVNEENAAGGRVVTAPTNGAAGIIPAVAHYYARLLNGTTAGIERYFLAATAIGGLYKENASISGAEVGCQGEVGVACSMAAAGLVAALEGTNEQVEHAAEIGMEHNLGMTCDPVGGLVQIPCIERNAFGTVKAVNAARMSMQGFAEHKVSLDQVIKTMFQTGLDMQSRYKETSLGGLALNVIEC